MRTLIVLNGPPGMGKTTVSKALQQKLMPSVMLDGDWCWFMNPWQVTAETKDMVEDNITHLLNNFLGNTAFEFIIFCWVLHRESIWQRLRKKLDTEGWRIVRISLTASPESLHERMVRGGRTDENIGIAIERLKEYADQPTLKIDTTDLSADEVAERICELIGER